MNSKVVPVRDLDESDVDEAVSVLCDAFESYPVMRFVLGPDDDGYRERHRRLTRFFVMARIHRNEPMLGIPADASTGGRPHAPPSDAPSPDDASSQMGASALSAVALVSYPNRGESPSILDAIRAEVWRELGLEALERYQTFSDATRRFALDMPQVHLNMIGVRRSASGTGLGGRLMDAVHDLAEQDPHAEGVTLTTEDPGNVPFYEHFGYEIVGRARVSPEVETWGFFRPTGTSRPRPRQ